MTLAALFERFPDDATAERWFIEQRWGGEPHCPHCGSTRVQAGAPHRTMPFRCRDCWRRFSVRTTTAMQASNLGYRIWAIAMYLLTSHPKGVSSLQLARMLEIRQATAWHLAHRIRTAWREDGELFPGPVEADETYMGGLESNKHASRKLRAGRGPVGKAIVAGVKDRASGRVSAAVVPDTTRATMHRFVRQRARPGAAVFTDESMAYRGLANHRTVRHRAGQYVDGEVHTNGLESFWALLKRGHRGVYHYMSPKHLHRYVVEFSGRQNGRHAGTLVQMGRLVRGLVGPPLTYRALVAPARA